MSILAEISVSAGAYQTGGVTVLTTDTIQARLNPQTSGGVWKILWTIYGAPPAAACPAGWTADAAGTFSFVSTAATALMPPLIALTGQPWGKWLLRATANDGVMGGAVDLVATVDELTAWTTDSPGAVEDMHPLEDTQFDTFGALGVIRSLLRGPMMSYASAAELMRGAYDYAIGSSGSEVAVLHDAGETWQTLGSRTLAQVAANATSRAITIVMHVTETEATPQLDVVVMHAVYNRNDATNDILSNMDATPKVVDEGPAASVAWELELPIAGHFDVANDLLETRLWENGASIYLDMRKHATQDRSIHCEWYFEVV